MSHTNTFEDLEIWQLGCQLASDVSVATSCLGQDTLIDQMQHTADSIPSTIAAGANCRDTAGFIRFLRQSQEVSAELRAQLTLSESIRQQHGQPPLDGFHVLIAETEELSKLIQNLIESLKRRRGNSAE